VQRGQQGRVTQLQLKDPCPPRSPHPREQALVLWGIEKERKRKGSQLLILEALQPSSGPSQSLLPHFPQSLLFSFIIPILIPSYPVPYLFSLL
jgi:hypothetical protein